MTSPSKAPIVRWNPGDYAVNSASQQSWARELIATLDLRGNERILDIGCGDGKVTAELARAVPDGAVVGIDSSAEMIGFAARAFPPDQNTNLRFEQMDARQIRFADPFDLAFSNAALHWVDDHPAFLKSVSECMKPGGRLVVSCGGKGNAQEVFVALRNELRRAPWRNHFRNLQPPYFFHSPADYEKWLPRFGFEARVVRLAEKEMVFDNPERFTGWLRTTWLPYTQRVPEPSRETFIAAVVERYLSRHPLDSKGRVRVRMVRLEIDALKRNFC